MKNAMNPDAAEYFKELEKTLKDNGTYSPGDEKPLQRLAHLYSVADRFEQEMNDAWSEKMVKQNMPLFDKILKNILSLETAFQLNPGSRSRAKLKPATEKKKGFDTSMRKP